VLFQDRDDGRDIDFFVVFPDVVVGRQRNGCVAHFGFAGESSFGHGGHADDGGAPGAVHVAFGAGAEGGAFHADGGAAVVDGDAFGAHGTEQDFAQHGVEGTGEFHVYGHVVVQGVSALVGLVDDVVRDHEVAGGDFFFERADGADGD